MKAFASAMLVAAGLFATSSACADEALAQAKGCMVCHKIDAKLIGPAYKEVAAKYTSADIPTLAEKVQKGGSGVWGTVPMAPNNVTPDEATKLVTWVLSLK
ncbi:MAG: c-type cytochrome [Azoarcus sp.]|jgi:cytochrome c|nr:c-type cytochrome [Azoarcus sp.]